MSRDLNLVLNKSHFGDYNIAIKLLVEHIEKQDKRIEELESLITQEKKD